MIEEIREIIEVQAMDNFTLICTMENGEIYEYDMAFGLHEEEGEVIEPLRISTYLTKFGLMILMPWNGPTGFGIHGDTVARDGQLISQAALPA